MKMYEYHVSTHDDGIDEVPSFDKLIELSTPMFDVNDEQHGLDILSFFIDIEPLGGDLLFSDDRIIKIWCCDDEDSIYFITKE